MGLSAALVIKIKGVTFKNPVLVASGTFGYAEEFSRFYDLKKLGGIVTKTITLKPRIGNPPQRVVETPAGMLNAIGLQNVGAENFLADKLPYLEKLKIPIIASVMGYSLEEFVGVVRALDGSCVAGFELNLSCPNVAYEQKGQARMFAHDAKLIADVVRTTRQVTSKLLIAKLGPDVSEIGQMAKAAEDAGADAVSLVNTFQAMMIDVKTRKPVLKNRTGGLSGPCIRPMAVRMVYDVAQAVSIPVMGMGGIMNTRDALEFMIAGASCVQIGTANFVNPTVCPEIIQGIQKYLKETKLNSIKDLIGSVRQA